MVRSCARAVALLTMICWVLAVMNVPAANAQEDNPFGDPREQTKGNEDPFGDSVPKDPPADDPFSSGPPKVAAKKTPAAPKPQRPASSNERVREALDQPTQMEFIDTPLQDAVNFLKDFHQIEIQLDHRALEDAGVGSDTPVSRNLVRLPLKSALRIVLSDLDLAYIVQDDVLLITTQDKASEKCEVRVYDVTKLVAPDAKAEEILQTLTMLLSETVQRTAGGETVSSGLQRIRIVPLRNLLVILASQEEHEEIAKILEQLAKALAEETK